MSRRPHSRAPWPTRSVAASLLAALLLSTATAASAADLSYGSREPGYDDPYDDPRYADIYRHPPPRADVYRESFKDDDARYRAPPRDDYDDDGDDVPPRRYSDRDRGYLPPMREPPRFSSVDRFRDDRRHDGCTPRHLVKQRLRAEGWSDFHDLALDGDTARVRARRPSGRLFELQVDRCSGEIVNARPFGPHAFRDRRYPSRS